MMRLSLGIAPLLCLLLVGPLAAQPAPPAADAWRIGIMQPTVWVHGRFTRSPLREVLPAPGSARSLDERHLGRRFAFGLGGAALGAVAGGLLGYELLPHEDCRCEDPGLEEMLLGATVGAPFGAALFAALPAGSRRCGYAGRLATGFLGAAAGGALGLLAPEGGGRVLLVSLGAASGSALGSAACNDRRAGGPTTP